MTSRGYAFQEWLTKSWASDFFQALNRRLPLIIMSSLALVLAGFSASISSSAVAWSTGAGVAFMLAFLFSFLVRALRDTFGKAAVIATVYGLTGLGLLCLFAVAGEFAKFSWPAGVALRIFRYGMPLSAVVFSFTTAVPRARDLLGDLRKASRVVDGIRWRSVGVVGILVMEVGGAMIMIVSSVADIALGEPALSYSDVLAWQTLAVALIGVSVVLGAIASRRWTNPERR